MRAAALTAVVALWLAACGTAQSRVETVRATATPEDALARERMVATNRASQEKRVAAFLGRRAEWSDAIAARRAGYADAEATTVGGRYQVFARTRVDGAFSGEIIVLPVVPGTLVLAAADRAESTAEGLVLSGNLYWELPGGLSSIGRAPGTQLTLGDDGSVRSRGGADTFIR